MNKHFEFKKALPLNRRFFYLILAVIPLVYLIFFAFKYKIDAPVVDDWEDMLPMLDKYYQGTLSLSGCWDGRYGQSTFFPRIISLILTRLGRWDFSYMLTAMILVATGTFVVLSYQIKRTAKTINNQGINWIIPIVSLIVFSLNQYENWSRGHGLSYFLTLFAAVAGMVFLADPVFKWSHFRSALLLGIFATCSNASGICYWFSGLFILFFVSPYNRRIRKLSIILWMVVAFIVIYLYTAYGVAHPSLRIVSEEPVRYIKNVVKYLGAPLAPFYGQQRGFLFLVGSLGLIFLCYVSWLAIRLQRIKFQVLVPYISMSLYSIGAAVLTMYGRMGKRCLVANSLYMTNASLFWVSIVVLLYLLISRNSSEAKSSKKNKFGQYAWSSILMSLICLMVFSSVHGTLILKKRYYNLLPAQNELLTLKDDELLRRLHHHVTPAREGAAILKKYHLSVFRNKS